MTKQHEKPKMFELVIDRERWVRFDPDTKSRVNGFAELLNNQNCMCCLGFASKQYCRIPESLMRTVSYPTHIPLVKIARVSNKRVKRLNQLMDIQNKAVRINDQPQTLRITTTRQQEAALKKLFKTIDIELKFVGKTAKQILVTGE